MVMGVVTDTELDRHAMWVRLENEDKQADTQRMMALVSMCVSIAGVYCCYCQLLH